MYPLAKLGNDIYRDRLARAEEQRSVEHLLALHRAERRVDRAGRRMRRAERQVRRLRTLPLHD